MIYVRYSELAWIVGPTLFWVNLGSVIYAIVNLDMVKSGNFGHL